MSKLVEQFLAFLSAGGALLLTLASLLVPLIPLLAWMAFWSFAVEWTTFRATLRRGGWVVVVAFAAIGLAVAAATQSGTEPQQFGPLTVSPLAYNIGWTALLLSTMFYAGALQLSREAAVRRLRQQPLPPPGPSPSLTARRS